MRFLKRTSRVLIAALCASSAMFASAAELTIGLSAPITSLDPHYHNLTPNNALSLNVFEDLLSTDEFQNIKPGLAESWRNLDPLTYEFKLRKGVKWHDGSPFVAADVLASLKPLAALMGSFYLTCLLFVLGVLGLICALTGFSIVRFIVYIRAELLTVLGTSSSESALVPLMEKLERAGCSKAVVGLVVPAGYSFNLDGTNIYLTMAALFVAQALNIELTLRQEVTLLLVAMVTSKGASGVTGAGFITLAATLAVVPSVPVAGLALILGIDRFMSEARALTNFIGNGVAAVVIARWEGELDPVRLSEAMTGRQPPSEPKERAS